MKNCFFNLIASHRKPTSHSMSEKKTRMMMITNKKLTCRAIVASMLTLVDAIIRIILI